MDYEFQVDFDGLEDFWTLKLLGESRNSSGSWDQLKFRSFMLCSGGLYI